MKRRTQMGESAKFPSRVARLSSLITGSQNANRKAAGMSLCSHPKTGVLMTKSRIIRIALVATLAAPFLALAAREVIASPPLRGDYCKDTFGCPGGNKKCVTDKVGNTCYKDGKA